MCVRVCPPQTWLQGGKKEDMYVEMYLSAMKGLVSKLLRTSATQGYAYLTDLYQDKGREANKHKMDHLACFVPGMLALGAHNA